MEKEKLRLQKKEQMLAGVCRESRFYEWEDCLLSIQSSPTVMVENTECYWHMQRRQGVP